MSLTAIVNAVMRAHHDAHDAPKIFDDFLAAALFAPDERAGLERQMVTALALFDPAAAALGLDPGAALARSLRVQSAPILLARARYAEDRLDGELARGAVQYVVLGAGLDTFAFRRRDRLGGLRVFEVDRPEAQLDKRRRIARAGWQVPAQLRCVALDLVTGDLATALAGDRSAIDLAGHRTSGELPGRRVAHGARAAAADDAAERRARSTAPTSAVGVAACHRRRQRRVRKRLP